MGSASLSVPRTIAPRQVTTFLPPLCYNPGKVKMNIRDLQRDESLLKTSCFSET